MRVAAPAGGELTGCSGRERSRTAAGAFKAELGQAWLNGLHCQQGLMVLLLYIKFGGVAFSWYMLLDARSFSPQHFLKNEKIIVSLL